MRLSDNFSDKKPTLPTDIKQIERILAEDVQLSTILSGIEAPVAPDLAPEVRDYSGLEDATHEAFVD